MLTSADLSLEQAPPISVPFRFFLTAPLFGLAASLLALHQGPALVLTRWLPATAAFVHLLTIGFVLMVMCGALLQLLPVLAAAPVPKVVAVAGATHLLLVLGTCSLVAAFLSAGPVWLVLGLLLLGVGLLLFIAALSAVLWPVRPRTATIVAMLLALLCLLATLLLGLLAGVSILGLLPPGPIELLTDLHLVWGLAGAVGLLLIGVAYQVVPLFQVTPEYPFWFRRTLVPGLFLSLLVWSLTKLAVAYTGWAVVYSLLWLGLVAGGYVLFAVATLLLQQRRRRRINDITVIFWRVGMSTLILCLPLWAAGQLFPALGSSPRLPLLFGVLLILGVAVAVVSGMLYRIVAFLPWFHLQHRQLSLMRFDVNLPHMRIFVAYDSALRQFYLWLLSFVAALIAVFWPYFVWVAGILFALSNLLLLHNMLSAVRCYLHVDRLLRAAPPGT